MGDTHTTTFFSPNFHSLNKLKQAGRVSKDMLNRYIFVLYKLSGAASTRLNNSHNSMGHQSPGALRGTHYTIYRVIDVCSFIITCHPNLKKTLSQVVKDSHFQFHDLLGTSSTKWSKVVNKYVHRILTQRPTTDAQISPVQSQLSFTDAHVTHQG